MNWEITDDRKLALALHESPIGARLGSPDSRACQLVEQAISTLGEEDAQ
jgi:hypothetical protein